MKLITMIFFFTVAHTKKTTPIKGSTDHKISGNEHNNSLRQRKNSYDKKYIPPRQLEVSLVKLLQVKCFTTTLTVFKFQNQSYTLYLHVHIIFLNWPSWSDFSLIVVHYVRWERRGKMSWALLLKHTTYWWVWYYAHCRFSCRFAAMPQARCTFWLPV